MSEFLPYLSFGEQEVIIFYILRHVNIHTPYAYRKAEDIEAFRGFLNTILSVVNPNIAVHSFVLYLSPNLKSARIYYNRKFFNISFQSLKLDMFPKAVRDTITNILKKEGLI